MNDYLPILLMVGLVVAFVRPVVHRVAAARTRSAPNSAKQAPYECGIVPELEPAERFPVKFYLVAMAFIVLDVEIVFLYPFATVFRQLGLFGLVAMGVFVLRAARSRSRTSCRSARSTWGPVQRRSRPRIGPLLRTRQAVFDPAAIGPSPSPEHEAA